MLSIAFDGLDPVYVKKFGLSGLMQESHGIVDVSGDTYTKQITPAVVSVHLTGTTDYVEEFRKGFKAGNSWLPFLEKLHEWGGETIEDEMENAHLVNVPGRKPAKEAMKIAMQTNDEDAWEEKKDAELEVLDEQLQKLIEHIGSVERPRLLWNWFYFPDDLEHIRFGDLDSMKELYEIAEATLEEIKHYIGDDELILVWSDHGFYRFGNSIRGMHSEEGFWSLNKDIDLKNPTHEDLHEFEKEMLVREEEDFVSQRLEDMGYFGR